MQKACISFQSCSMVFCISLKYANQKCTITLVLVLCNAILFFLFTVWSELHKCSGPCALTVLVNYTIETCLHTYVRYIRMFSIHIIMFNQEFIRDKSVQPRIPTVNDIFRNGAVIHAMIRGCTLLSLMYSWFNYIQEMLCSIIHLI